MRYLYLLILVIVFNGCTEEPIERSAPTFLIVQISTSFGNIYGTLLEETPLHKANFISLAEEGFYDSTEFHRLVKDFVIQGGDPNSKDDDRSNDGGGGPGYTIPAEIDSSKFKHLYGAIAAARLGDNVNPERESSGSQFYIVTDTAGESFLDGKYTVFGQVVKGMDVSKAIESQPKNTSGLPFTRIPMEVEILHLDAAGLHSRGIILE